MSTNALVIVAALQIGIKITAFRIKCFLCHRLNFFHNLRIKLIYSYFNSSKNSFSYVISDENNTDER
jgi:hypothetical protein